MVLGGGGRGDSKNDNVSKLVRQAINKDDFE